ncbi:MAG: hypothetical protein ACRCYY_21135 [Trueperaceae bacterium]
MLDKLYLHQVSSDRLMATTMIHTLPRPQNIIIGTFLFLLAAVCAAAPMPLIYRSIGLVVCTYLAFSAGGMPFAYLTALLAPPIGLISGDQNWLILLPIIMSSLLLSVLALEYAWRYPALILSPLLYTIPQFVAMQLSRNELFAVDLPWEPAQSWVGTHALTALAGVLIAIYLDRRRERNSESEE